MLNASMTASNNQQNLWSRSPGSMSRGAQILALLNGAGDAAQKSKAESQAANPNGDADAARKARAKQKLEEIKAQVASMERSSLPPATLARRAGELGAQLAGLAQDLGGTAANLTIPTVQQGASEAALVAQAETESTEDPSTRIAALPDAYRDAVNSAAADPSKDTQQMMEEIKLLALELREIKRRGESGPARGAARGQGDAGRVGFSTL